MDPLPSVVFVRNIPDFWTIPDLINEFSAFGEVQRAFFSRHSSPVAVIFFKLSLSAEIFRQVLSSHPILVDSSKGPLQLVDHSLPLPEICRTNPRLLVRGLPVSHGDCSQGRLEQTIARIFGAFADVVKVELVAPDGALVEVKSLTQARRAMQTVNWRGLTIEGAERPLSVTIAVSTANHNRTPRGL